MNDSKKEEWHNLRYYPGIYVEELRNATKNVRHDNRSQG
jgi:hypothetical protein